MKATKLPSAALASRSQHVKQLSKPRGDSGVEKGTVLLRSEKRSWFSVAITGFGGVLVQYLKTVRERLRAVRTRPANPRRIRGKKPF
jgi:hypothetical protein